MVIVTNSPSHRNSKRSRGNTLLIPPLRFGFTVIREESGFRSSCGDPSHRCGCETAPSLGNSGKVPQVTYFQSLQVCASFCSWTRTRSDLAAARPDVRAAGVYGTLVRLHLQNPKGPISRLLRR
jgi:hypothetical protein